MGTTNVVQLPVAGGIDQKIAEQYLDPASALAVVQNGNHVKADVVDKRNGIEHLPNSVVSGSLGAMSSGVRAVGWSRSGLSLLTSSQSSAGTGGLYSYSVAESGVAGVAQLPACAVRRTPVIAPGTGSPPLLCDFPLGASTARAAVYYDANFNVYATVSDLVTGDVVVEPVLIYTCGGTIGAGTIPLIRNVLWLPNAAADQQLNVFIYDANTSQLSVATLATSTLAFSAFTPLVTATGAKNASAAGAVDVAPYVGDPSGGYLVLYAASKYIMNLVYYQGTSAITTQTVETLSGTNYMVLGAYVVGIWGESVFVQYTYFSTGSALYDYRIAKYQGNTALTLQVAPTFLISGTAAQYYFSTLTCLDSGRCFVQYYAIWTPGPSGMNAPLGTWATLNSSLAVVATGATPLGFLPAARAFVLGGIVYQAGYLALYLPSSFTADGTRSGQITAHMWQYTSVNASPATDVVSCYPVATVAPRQVDISGVQLSAIYGELAALLAYIVNTPFMSQSVDTATRYAFGIKTAAIEIAARPTSTVSGFQGAAWQVDCFFDAASLSALYQANELGNALHISGGVPCVADGATAFEASFFYYPEFTYANLNASSTSSIPASGTHNYTYAVFYMYPDAAGLIHRSAPAFTTPIAVTNGSHGVQLHIPALSVTWRDRAVKGQVYAEIYRTVADGGTFYYVDRVLVSGQTGTPTEIVWPAICDNVPDASIQVASLLYTTGNVLDGVNPPSAAFQCVYQSRIAIVDETLRNVWFTTQFSPGEAPRYNEALVVPFNEGGNITAVATMDDKFVVFKQSSIWIMSGDGPAVTGQGSNWSTPQRVASDVGCVAWQSVVLTPLGLMFQAHNGIYLLGRDLTVVFIGKNVVDTLALYPTITSAVLVPDFTQVRFTCSDGSSTIAVIYDYLLQAWLTHTYPSLNAPVASACLNDETGQYSLLTTDGEVWQERTNSDPARCLDTDSSDTAHFVPTTVTWAWVKPSGLQGYQRLRWATVFGQQQESCGVTMTLATNYNDTPVQTATWPAADLASLQIPGQLAMHPSGVNGKSQAVQISVTDTAPASPTTGAGMRWVGLSLELDLIGPRWRRVPVAGRR